MSTEAKGKETPSFYDIASAIAAFCDRADEIKKEQEQKRVL